MTPCMVRLAPSAAHSSSVRYSEVKGSASDSGPDGPSRRSAGNRSRSVGTLQPRPASASSQPRSSTSVNRIAKSVRTAQEELCDGSYEANRCTSRAKSAEPPTPGSAQTSSSRKSRVISWIRQGREVCAVFGSLIPGPLSIRFGRHADRGCARGVTLGRGARRQLWKVAIPPQDAGGRSRSAQAVDEDRGRSIHTLRLENSECSVNTVCAVYWLPLDQRRQGRLAAHGL